MSDEAVKRTISLINEEIDQVERNLLFESIQCNLLRERHNLLRRELERLKLENTNAH